MEHARSDKACFFNEVGDITFLAPKLQKKIQS